MQKTSGTLEKASKGRVWVVPTLKQSVKASRAPQTHKGPLLSCAWWTKKWSFSSRTWKHNRALDQVEPSAPGGLLDKGRPILISKEWDTRLR